MSSRVPAHKAFLKGLLSSVVARTGTAPARKCRKCPEANPDNFYRTTKGKLWSVCKSCHKEYMKDWFRLNRERWLLYLKKRRSERRG